MQKKRAAGLTLQSNACTIGAAWLRSRKVASSDGQHSKPGDVWAAIARLMIGTHLLALADQAIVSGASFLTLVLVSRWTNPSQLGLYSIGISVLISTLAIQYSLVSLPYTIQRHRPLGTPAEHAGMSFTQSCLLSAISIVLLAVTAFSLARWGANPDAVAMTWALAATVPFALTREFARRCAFARLRMGEALILDSAVAALQFAGLYWLRATGRISPATACAAIGVACAVTSMLWLYISRAEFAIRTGQMLAGARRNWALGKWLLAGQITVSLQSYINYWLLALLLGSTATGVYAASMSIASVMNPLMTGTTNAVGPKAVLALKEGGLARLRRETARDSTLLGLAMGVFCLMLAFFADDFMRVLYHGEEFANQGETATLLGLGLLASAVGFPASFGLASLERPQAIVWAGSIGVAITVILGLALMTEWGPFGAACGFLAGSVAAALGLWIAFLRPDRRDGSLPNPDLDDAPDQVEAGVIGRGAVERVSSTDASVGQSLAEAT